MTLTQLQLIVPGASTELLGYLVQAFQDFEVNTNERQACCLAQLVHESLGFRLMKENLNYSAPRLLKIFPKYFSPSLAAEYAHKEEAIGNRVYANRMGNGPEESGDGYRYRGRCAIQATGKDMYTKLGIVFNQDFLNHPELLESLEWGVKAGVWIFAKDKACLPLADKFNVKAITKRINGGYIGLMERVALSNKILGILRNV